MSLSRSSSASIVWLLGLQQIPVPIGCSGWTSCHRAQSYCGEWGARSVRVDLRNSTDRQGIDDDDSAGREVHQRGVRDESPRLATFTERDEPKDLPTSGYAKDAVDIEGYIRHFVRRRGDVDVTVLRFTNLIGPRVDTVLTRYFALPVVPKVLGYDGRIQLLHEQDALAVLDRATRRRLPGVFNVGDEGSAVAVSGDSSVGPDPGSHT